MKQIIMLALLLAGARAFGEDTRGAREHYEKGTALYDLGQYREAAHEYEEAFKLKPSSALLFNIGQAYRLAGDETPALRAYRGYLRREPQATNRSEAEGHIARLEQALAAKRAGTATAAPVATEPKPVTAPEPVKITPPPPAVNPPPVAVVTSPASHAAERTPTYKKWWVWTIVGGVVAAGVGVGVGLALTLPKDVAIPSDAHGVHF
jgi:hypothetical protein